MAMTKIISPAGWDFDAPIATSIKVASAGLRGHDRTEFVKRASGSENVFLPYIDQVKFAEDEHPVHLLALGADEKWGSNRNGDAFSEKTCRDYHDTFVKFARFYRNHKNKSNNGDLHYGRVKLSAYNEKMARVELLIGLYKTKQAAEKYGGALGRHADRELEKLAKDQNLAVSMACRIPFDKCAYCGNEARTRDEYCTSEKCAAGGCKDNLTRLVKIGNDVYVNRVLNPHPTWFDISDVYRPACRTAYGNTADWMKTANDSGFLGVGGAKLAEDFGIVAPLPVVLAQDVYFPGQFDRAVEAQVKLAHGLDAWENRQHFPKGETYRAFSADVQPALDHAALGLNVEHAEKIAAVLGALADQKIVLSLREFAKMAKRAEQTEKAASVLPGAYGRMLADGTLEARVRNNPYAPVEKMATGAQRRLAARLHSVYSLDRDAVRDRCMLSTLRGYQMPVVSGYKHAKTAADDSGVEMLARDYVLYKLAALHRIAEFDDEFPLTAALAISQNQVI